MHLKNVAFETKLNQTLTWLLFYYNVISKKLFWLQKSFEPAS